MPGWPGATVVTTLVWFLFFPREAAGAMGARHSPRPLWAKDRWTTRARSRRGGCGCVPPRHCLRQTQSVCARERQRRSNPLFLLCGEMDCFASLAMTGLERLRCLTDLDWARRMPLSCSLPPCGGGLGRGGGRIGTARVERSWRWQDHPCEPLSPALPHKGGGSTPPLRK